MATYVIGPNQKVGLGPGGGTFGVNAGTNLTDITDQLTAINFDETRDILDTTALSKEAREYLPGLRSGTGTMEFLADYSSAEKSGRLIRQEFRASVASKLKIALNNGSNNAGADNPYEALEIWISGMPRSGTVGEVATMSVPFTINGDAKQQTAGAFTAVGTIA